MAEGKVEAGNRKTDFTESAPDLALETERVKAWRFLIDRSVDQLQMGPRTQAADEGDKYLDGTKEAKNAQKVYSSYLLPLLEDVHRASLPEIPEPRVEARNEAAEPFEDEARAILSVTMGSDYSGVLSTCRQLQWDDDRGGMAIVKTVWEVDFNTDKPADTRDPEQLGYQVEEAQAENQQILEGQGAQIKASDIGYVHLSVHGELDAVVMPESPEAIVLAEHKAEHEANEVIIMRERPVLKRVPWYRFVYDVDVPWEERGWEAEQRSEKISDMLEWGWKNVNKENIHPEVKEGETGSIPFEFQTAKVWHIHNRRTGQHLVISADGPREGLFLKQGDWRYGPIDIYQPLAIRQWKVEDGFGLSTINLAIPILERLAEVDFYIDRHVKEHANYKAFVPTMAGAKKLKSGIKDPNQRIIDVDPAILAGFKEYAPPPIPEPLLKQHERLMGQLRHLIGADVQDTGGQHAHQITATESAERGEAKSERADDRQKINGDFLGRVSRNFLMLYKKFATQDVLVRIIGPQGADYKAITPTDLPEELDIYVDVTGETDSGRERRQIQGDSYGAFLGVLQGMGVPIDWIRWNNSYGRLKGMRNPAEFILAQPAEEVLPGQPGAEGAAQPEQPGAGAAEAPPDRGYAPARETLTGSQ